MTKCTKNTDFPNDITHIVGVYIADISEEYRYEKML